MRLFRHPRWQHLDYRLKVATTQENKPPTQGTRQWTFTTPRWRCGSILLPSLNAGVPEPTGGVRPERFPGICRGTHWGCGLKFCMLMYHDHLQNWLDYGHGLLIFLLLAPLWLSEMGQIWGFRAFPGECLQGMGWNFVCWCILTTTRTDEFMVMVCCFF